MSARLTTPQVMLLTSGAVLLGRFGHVLSEHEAQLVEQAGRRFQKKGRDAMVTANEWPVIEDAVAAMQRARAEMADMAAFPNTAGVDAAGAPAVPPQPAAGELL